MKKMATFSKSKLLMLRSVQKKFAWILRNYSMSVALSWPRKDLSLSSYPMALASIRERRFEESSDMVGVRSVSYSSFAMKRESCVNVFINMISCSASLIA